MVKKAELPDFYVCREEGGKRYTFERFNGTWGWYEGDGDLAHGPVSKDFASIELAWVDFLKNRDRTPSRRKPALVYQVKVTQAGKPPVWVDAANARDVVAAAHRGADLLRHATGGAYVHGRFDKRQFMLESDPSQHFVYERIVKSLD